MFSRTVLFLVGILFTLPPSVRSAASEALNVLTFNLRYDNPEDGPNAWTHRKSMVAGVFTEHRIDFAGLQEALAGQIEDLQRALPAYDFVGVGRDDGERKGEFAPIFYRRDRFTCTNHGTFWLSPTPEIVGSKGWDAALPRIATWGVFREQATGREVFFINTHFDHRGEEARRQSARLLIERCAALGGKRPIILTGDFNTTADARAIQTLTNDERLKLTNTETLSRSPHVGGQVTFNGFGKDKADEQTIDFVFVGPGIAVRSHGYFPAVQDGIYVSDHWPVVTQVALP